MTHKTTQRETREEQAIGTNAVFFPDSIQCSEEEANVVNILVDCNVVIERETIDVNGDMDGHSRRPAGAKVLRSHAWNLEGEIEGLRRNDNPAFLFSNRLDARGMEEIESLIAHAMQHKEDGGFFSRSGRHILHILPFLTAPR